MRPIISKQHLSYKFHAVRLDATTFDFVKKGRFSKQFFSNTHHSAEQIFSTVIPPRPNINAGWHCGYIRKARYNVSSEDLSSERKGPTSLSIYIGSTQTFYISIPISTLPTQHVMFIVFKIPCSIS